MPHTPVPPINRARAKTMRRKLTDAELKLWNELRAHRLMGMGFRRQFPIGRYIADFACPSHKIVVEVDGSQHAEPGSGDKMRDAFLTTQGWTVLRFWNHDVMTAMDDVCMHIVTVAGLPQADALRQAAAQKGEQHP
jgi:very-short-patch-repair endonuclease